MAKFMSVLTGALLAGVLLAGSAVADGPSGSSEDANQVTCGSGENVAGFIVYAGENGAEACNDGGNPDFIHGRIIVTSDQGGYVTADGDADNEYPLNGYIRADAGGVHCANSTNDDGTNPDQSANSPDDCQFVE